MSNYKLTVSLLSPLHIGDGNELRQGFDFMVKDGCTYRLNEDGILEEKSQILQRRRDGTYPLPGELLSDRDYQNGSLFRYVLPGFPRSKKVDARIKTCIKDVYDRPYIPGSSLKGAFRTALAWTAFPEVFGEKHLSRADFGRNRAWAAQTLEQKIFGNDPNHDLLRALQVSDCFGPQKAGEHLRVVNAQVLTRRSSGTPVELETIKSDTIFNGSLRVDDSLFSGMAEQALHFSNRRKWLDELTPRVQQHTRARLRNLIAWYEQADNTSGIANFLRDLYGAAVKENQAIFQLGWGTGWDGTTLWTHLQKDANLFEQLVIDYRLHRATKNAPRRIPGEPFPRSKRALMRVKEGVAIPAAPFGWALIELKEIK